MALKVISNANYQESVKSAQTVNERMPVLQESSATNVINFGSAGLQSVSSDKQNSSSESEQQKKQTQANPQQIKNAISQANYKMKQIRTRCEFTVHEETNRVSIKVIDRETQETIREIPPEETLEMVEKLWELAGLLVDEKR